MSGQIRLDAGDVGVQEIEREDCDECAGEAATHYVLIDFRSAGLSREIGRYCQACAEMVANRIRDGLPAQVPDDHYDPDAEVKLRRENPKET